MRTGLRFIAGTWAVTASLAGLLSGCGSTAPAGSPPPPRLRCVESPKVCGYPDPTTTGVPPGTRLTPSAGITVARPGSVITNLDVTGSIAVNANDVVIRRSRVTSYGPTGHNVVIAPGVRGTVIEDTTLRGVDPTGRPVQYGVINEGTDTIVGRRLQMYNCSTCWAGPGTLEDSYVISDAVIAGAHYEPVYYGGRAGPLILRHNTLLNPHEQTAVVFAGNDYGNQTGLTITQNLMAGGGFIIYGGAGNNPYGASTRDVTITDNRFSNRYWPHGGQYGVAASVNWSVTRWAGNRWDASGSLEAAPGGASNGGQGGR